MTDTPARAGAAMTPPIVKPDAEGWIKHDGSGCPVPADTLVDVRFRDGHERRGCMAGTWSRGRDWWLWRGTPGNNVIAYRLSFPADAPVGETEGPPLTFTYRNYRGEVAERTAIPKRLWWGSTEWHPEPQWFVTAFDLEKQAARDFAWKDMALACPPAPDAHPVREPTPASGEADVEVALEKMLHAVCGETGFANAVRIVSGLAYPWPALDEAESVARAVLSARRPG